MRLHVCIFMFFSHAMRRRAEGGKGVEAGGRGGGGLTLLRSAANQNMAMGTQIAGSFGLRRCWGCAQSH